MTSPTNPYTSTGSVGGSPSFVGREELLRELCAALRRPERSAFLVSGGPGMGRTSALDELASALRAERAVPVRFDVQDNAFDSLDAALERLAETIAAALGQPAPELGQWAEQQFCEAWLPATLAGLDGRRLVLLIDEFVVLEDPRLRQASAALLPLLGGLLERHAAQLAVVLAGDLRNAQAEATIRKHLPSLVRRQLSALPEAQAWALVRLSQVDRTMMWTNAAVDAVLERAGGHPAVIQTLCEIVWDRAASSRASTASAAMVQAAAPPAIELLTGIFQAMWAGLPPAARVALGAFAWSDREALQLRELAELLQARGLRRVGRELTEDAVRELRRQEVLAPEADGLRFDVPLFRLWLRENKPIDDIFSELDGVVPLADERYRAAAVRWQAARSPAARREAVEALKAVHDLNPDHTGAIEMLAAVALRDRDLPEALVWLERLHPLRPDRAEPYLTRVLLDLAEQTVDLDQRLRLYDRLLEVAPEQAEAKRLRGRLLEDRAAAALAVGDVAIAVQHANVSDVPTASSTVKRAVRARQHEEARREVAEREAIADLVGALASARRMGVAPSEEERLARQAELALRYERGISALEQGDREAALEHLSGVAAINPTFREASRYLHLAVTGQDPAVLAEHSSGRIPPALFGSTLALAAAFAFAWVLGVPAPGQGPKVERQAEALVATIPQAAAAQVEPRPVAPEPAAAPPPAPAPAASEGAAAPIPSPAPEAAPLPTEARESSAGAPLQAGWAAIHRRALGEAKVLFDRAVSERPTNPDGWYGVGYVAEMRAERESAVQAYCKARALGGSRAELLADVDTRLKGLKARCH
jgi:tetratricopeptide (TPR) repeat protein